MQFGSYFGSALSTLTGKSYGKNGVLVIGAPFFHGKGVGGEVRICHMEYEVRCMHLHVHAHTHRHTHSHTRHSYSTPRAGTQRKAKLTRILIPDLLRPPTAPSVCAVLPETTKASLEDLCHLAQIWMGMEHQSWQSGHPLRTKVREACISSWATAEGWGQSTARWVENQGLQSVRRLRHCCGAFTNLTISFAAHCKQRI